MSPDKFKKLVKLRKSLDKLDNSFIKLIKRRTELVNQVLKLKEYKNQIVDKKKDENTIINDDIEDDVDNIIYNLSYKKFDIQNNFYLVEALESTIKENNPSLILMKKVKAIIKYLDNENLIIVSENALFNNKTFETNFYNGVELFFEDQKLTGGNLDFIFEKNIAKVCKRKYAVAFNSGTDALLIGLILLGVKKGDEVITPPNSYIASTYNELDINSSNWFKHIVLIIILVAITLLVVSSFDTFGSTISMILLMLFWFCFSVGQFADGFFSIFKYIFGSQVSAEQVLNTSNMIPVIFPMVSIFIPYGLNLSYKLYTENRDKKFLKNTFGN